MDAVFVTKNSSIVLGVSELDYVWITHEGKSVRAKVVLIEPDDYKRIVKANGLKSDEELDMLVCIPAKIRLGLGIYEPGTSVQLERSVKDLFVKNAFAQMMTLLGLFIAVMSLPDIRMLHKALIFLLLSPVIIYSVLAEESQSLFYFPLQWVGIAVKPFNTAVFIGIEPCTRFAGKFVTGTCIRL